MDETRKDGDLIIDDFFKDLQGLAEELKKVKETDDQAS